MASVPELLLKVLDELAAEELERFQWHLQQTVCSDFSPIPKAQLENAKSYNTVDKMCQIYGHMRAVKITVAVLKKMNQNTLAEKLEHVMSTEKLGNSSQNARLEVQNKLKSTLKKQYEWISEKYSGNSIYLNEIYTDLNIMKGSTGGICTDHEVIQVEKTCGISCGWETAIECCDIFKARPEDRTPVRKVLTLGFAGMGKTVSVKKFILEWVNGNANSDIRYIFPFTFRSLNTLSGNYSLMQLIWWFFPDTKDENTLPSDDHKVLFIFDGLDESRVPLNFAKNEMVTDIKYPASLDVLIMSLIMEVLLPSALVWITSRPAAASSIPLEYFNQVTQIQGFSEKQKEDYFRKKITNQDEAEKIISHMKASRSLRIMCHIPVFCCLFATMVQKMLHHSDDQEIPTTLTGMYLRFLIYQTKDTKHKYHKTDNIVLKLGRLAFWHLQKGDILFYEEDLRACGIDVKEASVYSGFCTEIFKEDGEIQMKKCFSFVHLSIQEFLAAIYVFYAHRNNKRNPILQSITGKFKWIFHHTALDLHKTIVDKVLMSKSGNMDLFLRFLLGLSLESNVSQLKQLLPEMKDIAQNTDETIKYIKAKIRSKIPPDRSINLFFCLNELEDISLVEEVQRYMKQGSLVPEKLSLTQWSAVIFLLLTSSDTQQLFDLKKYTKKDEGLRRLLPVVGNSKKCLLDRCYLTNASCERLGSIISSTPSYLRELDLSDNELQDSGVHMLSVGLKNPHCKLETLRLSGCLITEKGCSSLASALKLNPSYLKKLDLSYNNPGDAGVQALNDSCDDQTCKLEELCFDYCGPVRMVTGPRKYACELTLDPNTAHQNLCLLDGNKKVIWKQDEQQWPDHPERFKFKEQVLCKEGLSRRSYWEVEWSGDGIHIGVAYKRIRRAGMGVDCWLGHNNMSWKLYCTHDSYTCWHDNANIYMSAPSSPRIGVFLDWEAGMLSFYNVCVETNVLTHLHTFCDVFSEPLYPGFRVLNSSAHLNFIEYLFIDSIANVFNNVPNI